MVRNQVMKKAFRCNADRKHQYQQERFDFLYDLFLLQFGSKGKRTVLLGQNEMTLSFVYKTLTGK